MRTNYYQLYMIFALVIVFLLMSLFESNCSVLASKGMYDCVCNVPIQLFSRQTKYMTETFCN